jgi:hypothetical protein
VDGASAWAVLEAGALSVNAPPDGVGRYDEQVTLNVSADATLAGQASWRVHLGTIDEAIRRLERMLWTASGAAMIAGGATGTLAGRFLGS